MRTFQTTLARSFLGFFLSSSLAWAAPAPLPKPLPSKIQARSIEVEKKLLAMDCPFMVQLLHPKNTDFTQLGFCFYPLRIEKGIFAAVACVGVIVEPDSGTKNPFYGKKGHWGIEGKCDPKLLKEKMTSSEVDKTNNPIYALRMKRKEGALMRLLRDDLKLWGVFDQRTEPE